MFRASNPAIHIADLGDVPAITQLLNSAYRGESSRAGWTTEADLIAGEIRTDEEHLQEVLAKEGSVLLKYTRDSGKILGCVNLQRQEHRLYLGMLSVSPVQQNSGIGKALLSAANEFAKASGCTAIYMTVISARTELIDWYTRHGYVATGEVVPFPEDDLTGKHLRELNFLVLEKRL